MPESMEVKVARIETDLTHIKDDLGEIKSEQKEVSSKIDNVASKIQELGGLTQLISAVQIQVNQNTQWISDNTQFISELKDERKDTKRRVRDFIFKWGFNLLLFVVVAYLYNSLEQANKALIKTLENGIVIEQIK